MDKLAKKNLISFREKLRGSAYFTCACCGMTKKRGQLAGAHNYDPSPSLSGKMVAPAAYAICLECTELPDRVIHQKVTASLAKEGLFSS